jgi:hypothetical protein
MYTNFEEVGDRDGGGFRFAFQDSSGEPAAAGGFPEPFDITFDEGAFTLSNCVYRRGPVTVGLSDVIGEVLSDGEQYIAVWFDCETGAGTAQVGASVASVTDSSVNESSAYYKVLLYKVNAVTTGGVMAVTVLTDYRVAPAVILYV